MWQTKVNIRCIFTGAVDSDDLFVPTHSYITANLTTLYIDIFHSVETSFSQSQCIFHHVGCQRLVLAVCTAECGVYLSVAEGVVISRQTAYTPGCGMGGT